MIPEGCQYEFNCNCRSFKKNRFKKLYGLGSILERTGVDLGRDLELLDPRRLVLCKRGAYFQTLTSSPDATFECFVFDFGMDF